MTLQERFFSKVEMDPNGGCWLWSGCQNHRGYGSFTMHGRARGPEEKTHRVSWLLHKGPVPDGMHVLHKCDVRVCVNPDHLFLGTNADNVADRTAKGRSWRAQGTKHHFAKLTEKDVLDIRERAGGWGMGRKLAKQYGVSAAVISKIKRGESWSHVQ